MQNESYKRPTILVAKRVKGEEEIPDGTVAVLTPDMPDVLSHVSVRARNCKVNVWWISFLLELIFGSTDRKRFRMQVCFATCFDPDIMADLESNEGKPLKLKPTSADVVYK